MVAGLLIFCTGFRVYLLVFAEVFPLMEQGESIVV